jgi:ketosteroid isomerase-like protein
MPVQHTLTSREAHVAVVRRFFALLHEKNVEAWGALWADDARILVFYPPTGFPNTINSKQEIVSGFRTLLGNFDSFDADISAIYPAADSDAICVEYTVRAMIKGGIEYTNSNIAVFRFRDGLIAVYHDYFDPRRFQIVVDALPQR